MRKPPVNELPDAPVRNILTKATKCLMEIDLMKAPEGIKVPEFPEFEHDLRVAEAISGPNLEGHTHLELAGNDPRTLKMKEEVIKWYNS